MSTTTVGQIHSRGLSAAFSLLRLMLQVVFILCTTVLYICRVDTRVLALGRPNEISKKQLNHEFISSTGITTYQLLRQSRVDQQKSTKPVSTKSAPAKKANSSKTEEQSRRRQAQPANSDQKANGPWPPGTPKHWMHILPGVTVCLVNTDKVSPPACKERNRLEDFVRAVKQNDQKTMVNIRTAGQCTQLQVSGGDDKGIVRSWNNGAWQVEMNSGTNKGVSFWVLGKYLVRCEPTSVPMPKLNEILSRVETTEGTERRIYAKLNAFAITPPPGPILELIQEGQPAIVPTGDLLLAAVQSHWGMWSSLERIGYLDTEGRIYEAAKQDCLAINRMIMGCAAILGEIGDQRALLLLERIDFSGDKDSWTRSIDLGLQHFIEEAKERITSRLKNRR